MRDYGVVSPKFWIGGTGKALRGNVEAQIVALYLMTSPHANMVGVFYCPLDTIAKESGLSIEGASKGLQSLIEADFVHFDADTEEVFVLRMAAYQVGEHLEPKDNRCKGVVRELDRVMSDGLRSDFRAIYSVAFHLPECVDKKPPAASPTQAPSKPLRSQKQDQKQEQEQEQKEDTPRKRGAKFVPDDFVVTDEMAQWASTDAPNADWQRETQAFRDWEFSKPRTDWIKTWRTWMRKASDDAAAKKRPAAGRQSEPEWRTEQRERTQQAAPGVAVGAPASQFFIDVDARDVVPALTRSTA